MDGRSLRIMNRIGIICVIFFITACGEALKTGRQVPGASSGGVIGGGGDSSSDCDNLAAGEVSNSCGFFVKIDDPDSELTATIHKTAVAIDGTTDFPVADLATELTQECKVPNDSAVLGTAAADISCILEIEELDLFFKDINLQIHVPGDACTYVRRSPYFFYAFLPGNGAATISHEELADGTFVDQSPTPATGATLNGAPDCPFDHRSDNGPNCCIGSFVHVTTTHTLGDSGEDITDTTSEIGNWGGAAGNCLAGPAILTQTLAANGRPIDSTTFVAGDGASLSYSLAAAIDQTAGGRQVRNNFWAASFYNSSEHPSGTPVAGIPTAMQIPATVTTVGQQIQPKDHYEFSCLDRFEDNVARIKIHVREWNRGPIDATGDPDDTSNEPGFGSDSYNDRSDWKDIEGVQSYPASII